MWVNDVGFFHFQKYHYVFMKAHSCELRERRPYFIAPWVFFAQKNFDSWSFIDRIDLHPKKKMTTFFPIFSTFFVEKVLVGVYVFNNSLYRTIKGLLMAKKDSECLDQGQGCKFVFLTFG